MKLRAIALFLCAAFLILPCVAFADFDAILPSPVLPTRPIAMPRPLDGEVLPLVSMEEMERSTEYYNNFISRPVEMFTWSEEGIMLSTGIASTEQYDYLLSLAKSLTSGSATTYEKIQTITMYIAKNVGFDHDYYTHKTSPYPPSDPYSTVTSGKAVCAGYAKTMEALLQMVGVPCVYIESPGHAWNLIYTGERWMLVDVTWMSNSRYEYGKLYRSEKVNSEWFDFSFYASATQESHIINKIPYAQLGDVLVSYPIYSCLDHIIWTEGLCEIGESAFYGARGFHGDLTLPEGITKIGEKAFYGCACFDGGLNLPDSLCEIGYGAFRGCTGLAGDLVIPDSVEVIDNSAFYGCTGFDGKLTLSSTVKTIGTHAFRECKFTGELALPEGLEELGIYAFSGCKFTGTLRLPQTLSSIARSAFRNCAFDEAMIPATVTDIAAQAFYGCNDLTKVYFEGEPPEMYAVSTENTGSFPSTVTLYRRPDAKGWTDSAYYDADLSTYKGYKLDVWSDAETFTLSASVTSYNPSIKTVITLVEDGEAVYSHTVDAADGDGSFTAEFSISDIEAGVYDLVVTKAGHLSYTLNGIEVDRDIEIETEIELVAGDVNGDGCVDLKDITALTSADTYGRSSEEAKTASADVNGDGYFDLKDLSIIASEKNYGKAATVLEYGKQ